MMVQFANREQSKMHFLIFILLPQTHLTKTQMRSHLLFLLIIFLTHCSRSVSVSTMNKYNTSDNIINDGHGFDSFEINKTTAEDVVRMLGRKFNKVKHGDHSVQMHFEDMGVSFYYYQDDETKEIFSIVFSTPFKGKTSNGIVLGQSTMRDVVRLYGEPDWSTCDGCDTWTSEYEGIQFSVERDKSVPQFPLNEELHLGKKIVEIEVTTD